VVSPFAVRFWRPAVSNGVGVVVLPAVGYAYSSSYHAIRVIAEALAERGALVARVDYPGTGDSSGETSGIGDFAGWRSAVKGAVGWLRELGAAKIVLLGLELGATLALTECAGVGASAAVAIHPVWSGHRFVRRQRLLGLDVPGAPGAIASAGSYFSAGLVADIDAIRLSSLDLVGQTPLLIIDLPDNPDAAPADGGARADIWHTGSLAEFLERPAEEAVADPELAARIARWVCDAASPQPGGTLARPLHRQAEVAPRIVEEFVTVGPDRLAGVLTRSASARPFTGRTLVLLNSGSDPHIGPGRAWVELARTLVRRGWSTLRVDWTGWGDSACGACAPGRPYDESSRRQTRRLASGLRAAGADTVVLAGLCAGAWVALDAAREPGGVDGVVALNPQLYWRQGDPVEALLANTRIRRRDEIAFIKEAKAAGRWDREDMWGLRPPAAVWLEELAERGTHVSLVFAEGDDGLEYLEDRMARRLKSLLATSAVRVREVPEIDHGMHRTWLRERMFATIAEELDTIRSHARAS